jgi:hypothetical protein
MPQLIIKNHFILMYELKKCKAIYQSVGWDWTLVLLKRLYRATVSQMLENTWAECKSTIPRGRDDGFDLCEAEI